MIGSQIFRHTLDTLVVSSTLPYRMCWQIARRAQLDYLLRMVHSQKRRLFTHEMHLRRLGASPDHRRL